MMEQVAFAQAAVMLSDRGLFVGIMTTGNREEEWDTVVYPQGTLPSLEELPPAAEILVEEFPPPEGTRFVVGVSEETGDATLVMCGKKSSINTSFIRAVGDVETWKEQVPFTVNNVVVITKGGKVNHQTAKVCEGLPLHFEFFTLLEMQRSVVRHKLVPTHVPLAPDSDLSKRIVGRYKKYKLPQIPNTDPVARWYGAGPGTIMHISRADGTEYFRQVVDVT